MSIHTAFQLPSVDSCGCRKAKQLTAKALLALLDALNLWTACGSAAGVLRGAGMQGGAMGLAPLSCSPVYAA